jgi:hypothetical protein
MLHMIPPPATNTSTNYTANYPDGDTATVSGGMHLQHLH